MAHLSCPLPSIFYFQRKFSALIMRWNAPMMENGSCLRNLTQAWSAISSSQNTGQEQMHIPL